MCVTAWWLLLMTTIAPCQMLPRSYLTDYVLLSLSSLYLLASWQTTLLICAVTADNWQSSLLTIAVVESSISTSVTQNFLSVVSAAVHSFSFVWVDHRPSNRQAPSAYICTHNVTVLAWGSPPLGIFRGTLWWYLCWAHDVATNSKNMLQPESTCC